VLLSDGVAWSVERASRVSGRGCKADLLSR
jgi:hypothetical protein